MKRDMSLVRDILLWMEKQEHGYADGQPQIEGYSEEEIGYHLYLMGQAGLVSVGDTTTLGSKSPRAYIESMTWFGHEFLDASNDEKIWKKAKENLLKPAATVSFEVLLEWLKSEALKKIGLQ